MLKTLISNPNINFNLKSNRGWAPLHYLARYGHYNLLLPIINLYNWDINIKDNNLRTPLHICCESGRYEMAVLFLSLKNIEPNSIDINGVFYFILIKHHYIEHVFPVIMKLYII